MAKKRPYARYSVANDDEVVLFLVGMRVNRVWSFRKWLPIFRAVKPMLREAEADKDSGLLGYRTYRCGLREQMVMLYWRSTKELLAFAQGETHRRSWTEFYRLSSAGGVVGLWHETYVVAGGGYEAIYGFVPEIGLAGFADLKPIGRRNSDAAARLRLH